MENKYPNIAGVNYESMVDGEGVRAVIFLSGCSHHCKGCQNEAAQDPEYGVPCTEEMIDEIAREIKNRPFLSGITLSGGDPLFCPEKTALFLSCLIRKLGEPVGRLCRLSLWIYTGNVINTGLNIPNVANPCDLLVYGADIIVDGPFVRELADRTLAFRGSSNQRILKGKDVIRGGYMYCCFDDVSAEYDRTVTA